MGWGWLFLGAGSWLLRVDWRGSRGCVLSLTWEGLLITVQRRRLCANHTNQLTDLQRRMKWHQPKGTKNIFIKIYLIHFIHRQIHPKYVFCPTCQWKSLVESFPSILLIWYFYWRVIFKGEPHRRHLESRITHLKNRSMFICKHNHWLSIYQK